MPDLTFDPPLPTKATPGISGFLQTVTLRDRDQPIAVARWHAPAGGEGVVQLVELSVSPAQARQGHARRLLQAVVEQATKLQRGRKVALRRMWISLEQKSQVNGRAFLTGNGFHHVATVSNLLKDQDALIYSRSFD